MSKLMKSSDSYWCKCSAAHFWCTSNVCVSGSADSSRARHPVHGDIRQVQHQHRPRLLRAGRGNPGQVRRARGRRRPRAHRRRAAPVARPARARLLLVGGPVPRLPAPASAPFSSMPLLTHLH